MSGTPALEGFEYQIEVSVYVALYLLIKTKRTQQIVLEPITDEDIEAALDDVSQAIATSTSELAEHNLIIQVKLRNTGSWTVSSFKELLEHGEKRVPAASRLQDDANRFLLVTNADVNESLSGLTVDSLCTKSQGDIPQSVQSACSKPMDGRVGIWNTLTHKLLEREIEHLLREICRIPEIKIQECKKNLKDIAREKMRGAANGVWCFDELVKTIKDHEGFLASFRSLDVFVPPNNYNMFSKKLNEQHAVIIYGASGTGKTTLAQKLFDELKRKSNYRWVNNVTSASTIISDVTSGSTVYYVEDPWGKNSLSGDADAWASNIASVLSSASSEKKVIVTTRDDLLDASGVDKESISRYLTELQAGHYENGPLRQIYTKRFNRLSPQGQNISSNWKRRVLDKLTTPLEIDIFFNQLELGTNDDENSEEFFQRILRISSREAIENEVVRWLGQNDHLGWAAVIWALISHFPAITTSKIKEVRSKLHRLDQSFRDINAGLLDRMISARHLRQPENKLSFAHPSIIAGFERHIQAYPSDAGHAIETLLTFLEADLDADETFRKVIALISRDAQKLLPNDFQCPDKVQSVVDDWLKEGLAKSTNDFSQILELSCDVGSNKDPAFKLARWLKLYRDNPVKWFDPKDYTPPKLLSEQEVFEFQHAELTSTICANFIRHILPWGHDRCEDTFIPELAKIVSDLKSAFRDAAKTIIQTDGHGNEGVILTALEGDLSSVLDDAVSKITQVDSYDASYEELVRKDKEGELDKYSIDEIENSYCDTGDVARGFIKEFIRESYDTVGLKNVLKNQHIPAIIDICVEFVCQLQPSPELKDDIVRIIGYCQNNNRLELAWQLIQKHWYLEFETLVAEQFQIDNIDYSKISSLVNICLEHHQELLIEKLNSTENFDVLQLYILYALAKRDNNPIDGEASQSHYGQFLGSLKSEYQELVQALSTEDSKQLPNQTLKNFIKALPQNIEPFIASSILEIQTKLGIEDKQRVEHIFSHTDASSNDSEIALAHAVKFNMQDIIADSITNKFAKVRVGAFKSLTRNLTGKLEEPLLQMHKDKSWFVREAVLLYLKQNRQASHLPALLTLSQDTWSTSYPSHDQEPNYSIARGAITALEGYDWSCSVAPILLELAKNTDDRRLSSETLLLIARKGERQDRENLLRLVFDDVPKYYRVDAARGLCCADEVEADLFSDLDDNILQQLPPMISSLLAMAIGAHASDIEVKRIASCVSQSTDFLALLLLVTYAIDNEKVALRDFVVSLLPEEARLDFCDALEKVSKLSENYLDKLGNVRIRKYVGEWLQEFELMAIEVK